MSITWSRTSTSSSTSDAPRRTGTGSDRLVGIIWLGHPFPSLLDGVAAAAFAVIARGALNDAIRLGLAMVCLQVSIGAFNDLRDAEADARSKAAKPLPSGRAMASDARALSVLGLTAGVLLSLPSGAATVALALAGVACGYVYDAWLKRTAWSWLPLAVALPLLPAYAWVGVGAGLPPGWPVLFPAAVLAGAALAISNALADAEADRTAGLGTVVARLGRRSAWWLHVALFAGVVGLALVTLASLGGPGLGLPPATVAVAGGIISITIGAVLLRLEPGAEATVMQPSNGRFDHAAIAWGVEALGLALLGLGWLATVASAQP